MGQWRVIKKLDRSMCSLDWCHSDNNPLLLRCGGLSQMRRSRHFRFEAAWITHPDYHKVVQNAWSQQNSSYDLVGGQVNIPKLDD